jgi:hypothetical protein
MEPTNYCLNCGSVVTGKYCTNCGQKTGLTRLTFKVLLAEIGHVFTHIEHYFLQSTWDFLARPGKSSLDYIKGKRKKFQKPVSFFIIWAGLYILLHNYIIQQFGYNISNSLVDTASLQQKADQFLRTHFTLVFLPILFTSSVAIFLVLGKPRLYYVEVLTLSLYGAGCFNAMLIGVDIILGVVFRVNVNSTPVFIFQTCLSAAYNFWFCYSLFSRLHTPWLWLRLVLTAIVISVAGLAIFIYFPLLWVG